MNTVDHDLLQAAQRSWAHAHAPFSRFKVSVAVRADDGSVYTGVNVENIAFPLGWCAEVSALGALASAGRRRVMAIALCANSVDPIVPCGGCRQRLLAFAEPDTLIFCGTPHHWVQTLRLGDLLPQHFNALTQHPDEPTPPHA